MRDIINLIDEAFLVEDKLTLAKEKWGEMSPMEQYKLIDDLPFIPDAKLRIRACIEHIAKNI